MNDCAARPRWAARADVLGHPDSRAIGVTCVPAARWAAVSGRATAASPPSLAASVAHSPIAPARRASSRFHL